MTLTVLFTAMEVAGTIAFAVSGATAAIQRRLDIFGVVLLGLTTALGGGCIRDLLLGITPPVMFQDPTYAMTAIGTSFAVFALAWFGRERFFGRLTLIDSINNIFDAIGLGVFAVVGVRAGMNAGYADNLFLCLFLGMLTGVGGGVLRDMMSREIPKILRSRVYALAALLGGLCYYLLVQYGAEEMSAAISGALLVFIIRMMATHYRWSLPRIRFDDEKENV